MKKRMKDRKRERERKNKQVQDKHKEQEQTRTQAIDFPSFQPPIFSGKNFLLSYKYQNSPLRKNL
jgi:hypothetical protein